MDSIHKKKKLDVFEFSLVLRFNSEVEENKSFNYF